MNRAENSHKATLQNVALNNTIVFVSSEAADVHALVSSFRLNREYLFRQGF